MRRSTLARPLSTHQTGEICLDLLKTAWSPIWTLASACSAIHQLLATPEPSSPLNVDAGQSHLFLLRDMPVTDCLPTADLDLILVPTHSQPAPMRGHGRVREHGADVGSLERARREAHELRTRMTRQ